MQIKRLFFRFFVLVAVFFATWFGLSQIDWITLFHIQDVSESTEKKLGDISWRLFCESERVYTENKILQPVDSLIQCICDYNNLKYENIKLHVVKSDEINAFALPDDHLVVLSGLIEHCQNESELAGVLAHEIAHMSRKHVTQKLVKEIGLTVLIDFSMGGNDAGISRELIRLLSSTAFDRKQEQDADRLGVSYLIGANINPRPFGDFLKRLSEMEDDEGTGSPGWISTHPDLEQRADFVWNKADQCNNEWEAVLSNEGWKSLKHNIGFLK